MSTAVHDPHVHGAPIKLSLRASFREVRDLGRELPIVLIAKAEEGGSYRRARYRRQRDTIQAGGVFREMRRSLDGFIRFGRLGALLEGDDSHRLNLTGLEPYDFTSHGALGLFALHDDTRVRVVDLASGELRRTLTTARSRGRAMGLFNVHTMQLHPRDPERALIAVTGLDRVIELHLPSGEATWEWCPWRHGMHTNEHGITLMDRGDPPPPLPADAHVERLDFETANARVEARERPGAGEVWLHEVDLVDAPARLGLLVWQRFKLINSAYYSADGSRVLMTFWQTGEAVSVDRETGAATMIASDLVCPHSVFPFEDGYVLTDTGGGRVLRLDAALNPTHEIDFTACPLIEGEPLDDPEWVQNTHPISADLLASFDFRRGRVIVWSPSRREYTSYPVDREWVLQAIKPIPASSLESVGFA
ncbi:MAG: hypothetical protein H6713_13555 [Myxococcales bacterium]|nr:hypothetical protein [Myxococcales bacterium]MCB9751009.1 hypothetical protein [Myxococcales bacterium]